MTTRIIWDQVKFMTLCDGYIYVKHPVPDRDIYIHMFNLKWGWLARFSYHFPIEQEVSYESRRGTPSVINYQHEHHAKALDFFRSKRNKISGAPLHFHSFFEPFTVLYFLWRILTPSFSMFLVLISIFQWASHWCVPPPPPLSRFMRQNRPSIFFTLLHALPLMFFQTSPHCSATSSVPEYSYA